MPDPTPRRDLSPAAFAGLVVVSVACGVAAFVVVIWVSLLLADPATTGVTGGTVGGMVAFGLLLVACILIGYYAARRRPPRPPDLD